MTATDAQLGQGVEDVKMPADDDLRHWSVTTLIGALDKPALMYWAAEQAALCAIRQVATWQAIEGENGTAEAVKWISGARFRTPKGERGGAELGTAVHDAIETYTLTGNRPDIDAEIEPYLVQFDRWAQTWQPSYQATEVTVFAPTYGYAGTCDAFLTIDGVRFIADYKTSKKSFDKQGKPTSPYPEVALQLAAYRYAEMAAVWRPRRFEKFRRRYYLLSENERSAAVPVPEVDAGLAVHITPEHCEAYPVRCGEDVFEQFLFVVEAARYLFETSRIVIGPPLTKGDA